MSEAFIEIKPAASTESSEESIPFLNEGNKCLKCKEFYINKDNLCSVCARNETFDEERLLIDTKAIAPKNMIEDKLVEIFNAFKKQTGLRHRLLDDKQSIALVKSCKTLSPNEIYLTFSGFRDFPPSIIRAKYADLLLMLLADRMTDKDKDEYRYIHAICPFVIDRWNFLSNKSVLLCYYKDLGELRSCPATVAKLYDLWSSFKGQFGRPHLKDEDITDCIICSEMIKANQQAIICNTCNTTNHKECLQTWIKTKRELKCATCQTVYDADKMDQYITRF
jgi:hypothetical protein